VDKINVVVQRVAAVQLALIRQVDALQVAAAMGASSTVAWLRDRHRISGGAAARLVKLARADASRPAGWVGVVQGVGALAAAGLDRLHAVAAHQREFGVPGRRLVAGPELIQLAEVVVERGSVQYQHMG
jgi:hypothetical protein